MNLTDNRIQKIIDENGGNFTVREFGDSRARANPELIKECVKFRNWHGFSTLLTSVWRPQGAHSIGAVDVILYRDWKHRQPDPMHLWRLATTWPWMGVGIYFDWQHGGKDVVGLHLDIVKEKRDRPLRWLRVNGDYFYQSLINGRFYNGDEETTLESETQKLQN